MATERLPSWRPGSAKDAILDYLDEVGDVPVEDRVAYFDNDGTMWCERPGYVQYDFFVDVLRRQSSQDPTLAERPEFAAVLDQDMAAIGEIGLTRIAGALAALCDGQTPAAFASEVDDFIGRYRPSTCRSPASSTSRCSNSLTSCAPTTSPSGSSPAAAPNSCAG
jgi:hypothetical protein